VASDRTRLAALEAEVKLLRKTIDSLLQPGPRATQEALWRMRELEREDNIMLRMERQGVRAFLADAVQRLGGIVALLQKYPRGEPVQDLEGFARAISKLGRGPQP